MTDQLAQLFAAAASGHPPARSEIDQVTIDDQLGHAEANLFRRTLIDKLDDVAQLAASGARGPARTLGKRLAAELGDQTAPPTPAEHDTDDPAELAAGVSRSDPSGNRPLQRDGDDPRSLAVRTRRGQDR